MAGCFLELTFSHQPRKADCYENSEEQSTLKILTSLLQAQAVASFHLPHAEDRPPFVAAFSCPEPDHLKDFFRPKLRSRNILFLFWGNRKGKGRDINDFGVGDSRIVTQQTYWVEEWAKRSYCHTKSEHFFHFYLLILVHYPN